jgi:hypothetical protein
MSEPTLEQYFAPILALRNVSKHEIDSMSDEQVIATDWYRSIIALQQKFGDRSMLNVVMADERWRNDELVDVTCMLLETRNNHALYWINVLDFIRIIARNGTLPTMPCLQPLLSTLQPVLLLMANCIWTFGTCIATRLRHR